MANGDDFKGGSPWGAPPGGKNGSGRGGPRPPNIDEVVEKIQKLIIKFFPGGKSGGSKPIIFGLILLVVVWAFSGLYRVLPDEQGVVFPIKVSLKPVVILSILIILTCFCN